MTRLCGSRGVGGFFGKKCIEIEAQAGGPSFLDFTTTASDDTCGTTFADTAGTDDILDLTCGGLNIGGGESQVAEGPTPDGSTNRYAEVPKDRPVHFQEVFATLYHNLGLDPHRRTVTDLSGRPHYLVDDGHAPLPELV